MHRSPEGVGGRPRGASRAQRLAQPDARDLFRRDDTDAQQVRDEIRAIEGKLLELTDDRDADLITRDQYLRSTARHRARLAELEKQVEKAVPGMPASLVAEMVGPNAKERLGKPPAGPAAVAAGRYGVRTGAGSRDAWWSGLQARVRQDPLRAG